jgi:hypothetical protein
MKSKRIWIKQLMKKQKQINELKKNKTNKQKEIYEIRKII